MSVEEIKQKIADHMSINGQKKKFYRDLARLAKSAASGKLSSIQHRSYYAFGSDVTSITFWQTDPPTVSTRIGTEFHNLSLPFKFSKLLDLIHGSEL